MVYAPYHQIKVINSHRDILWRPTPFSCLFESAAERMHLPRTASKRDPKPPAYIGIAFPYAGTDVHIYDATEHSTVFIGPNE
ncbi:unnamed protein product, partial [Iphiclides podalirius]